MPTVHFEAVALEVEIYEPHDGTPVARPSLLAEVGSPAEVSAEFTLRPARRHVRRLDLELTPTRVSDETCELDVRSQVLDDPRQRIAGTARAETIPMGQWVEVVTLDLVKARVRCSALPRLLASGHGHGHGHGDP
jgi:hypothetical protein